MINKRTIKEFLVITIGTLIVSPNAFNVGAAIGGGIAVLIFAGILTWLCIHSEQNLKKENALSKK